MAFKTITQFEEDKRGDFFQLEDDGMSADVIFLFKDIKDALMATVHYVKYSTYTGYVQCCESEDCPVCKKGIRQQPKLFIPLYNITRGKIEIWDRTPYFKPQLIRDVFTNFPNPSEFVFKITRHGAARDQNTTYEITVAGRNSSLPYDTILASAGKSIFDVYGMVCKDMTKQELEHMIALDAAAAGAAASTDYYMPKPRATGAVPEDVAPISTPIVDISNFEMAPPEEWQQPDAEEAEEGVVMPQAIAEPVAEADAESDDTDDVLGDVSF